MVKNKVVKPLRIFLGLYCRNVFAAFDSFEIVLNLLLVAPVLKVVDYTQVIHLLEFVAVRVGANTRLICIPALFNFRFSWHLFNG